MANLKDGLYGSFQVAKKVGVSLERLRYWEYVGIVRPKYVQCGTRRFRRYSEEDIVKAGRIKVLVEEDKYSLEGAMLKLLGHESQ